MAVTTYRIFSALYATYTGSSSPAAHAANVSDVDVFVEFMTRSRYFIPRLNIWNVSASDHQSGSSHRNARCFLVELHLVTPEGCQNIC